MSTFSNTFNKAINTYQNKPKKKEDPLKPYMQMGFKPIESNDNEVVGNCIFCNSTKFSINIEKKAYNCFVCGSGGGYKKFISECVDHFQENLQGEVAEKLVKNRNLSLETLHEHMIGYNPTTDEYIVPTMDKHNVDVLSIKRFGILDTGEKYFLNLSGSHHYLFNSHLLTDYDRSTVFLLEGEWDCMAMFEAIQQLSSKRGQKDNYIAVSVPGATTFKDEWIELFKDRDVIVVFDNDKTKRAKNNKKSIMGAGVKGGLKVHKKLSPVVKSIKYMHWPVGTKHKYDVRDCYIEKEKKGKRLIDHIEKHCRIYPKGIDREKAILKKDNVMDGAGATAKEVKDVYLKWLELKDDKVIDVLYGSFIGNRFSFVDPIWLFLVARSGFAKSELLMPFQDVVDSYFLSTLSENALVSGMVMVDSKEDPSLLPKLNENILIQKDFTTLLTGPEKVTENILGQFRSIYDGDYSKAFGTVERRYNSIFGFISGVTHVIEIYVARNPAYGERFLMYQMDDDLTLDESIDVIMKATGNDGKEKDFMRPEMKAIAEKCLHHTFTKPNIDIGVRREIATMSQCLAILRGATIRDRYRPDEILGTPKPEIGTRIAKALIKMGQGIAAFNGRSEVGDYELNILRRVVKSSVPSAHIKAIENIAKHDKPFYSEKDLSQFIGLTKRQNQTIISNLVFLEVLKANQKIVNGFRVNEYSLHKSLSSLMRTAKLI